MSFDAKARAGLRARWNPSQWIRRVAVVRSYRRINGALVPMSLESTAHLRLLGRSMLLMMIDRYWEIDDRATN
jgi:hypothetical protein